MTGERRGFNADPVQQATHLDGYWGNEGPVLVKVDQPGDVDMPFDVIPCPPSVSADMGRNGIPISLPGQASPGAPSCFGGVLTSAKSSVSCRTFRESMFISKNSRVTSGCVRLTP